MSTPTCWECGNKLMYHNGKPVFKITVVDGVEHRVHLQCRPDTSKEDARDDTLGMSGECLCGAFAHEGEKALVKIVCPQTAARIEDLERQTLARGFTWDWEGSPPENFTLDQSDMFMPMCVGCEKVHDRVSSASGDKPID